MKPETLKVLIVTDVSADAAQLVRLLEDQFEQLETSTIESHFVADFERVKPDVVVLAFPSLERAERYSLGLYRHSAIVHALPHRSIVLCDKDNVHRAFELCRKEYFDDYVMYWPLVYDTPRLAMSILIAGRALQRQRDTAPAREVAAHARSVSRLEAVIDDRIAVGQQHAAALNQALQAMEAGVAVTPASPAGSPDLTAIVHATPPAPPAAPVVHFELEAGSAETFDLDFDDVPAGLDRQTLITTTGPAPSPALSPAPAPNISPHSDVIREVRLRVDGAQKRVVPLTEWIGGLKHAVKPQLDAARRLGELAGNTPLRVLVVDDDSFQCKLLERMLGNAGYATLFAHSGAEALALLGRQHPDLILMDVALPDLNGVEITQRLKASPGTAAIPIMMITGHSERPVLAASLKAGAVDFLVKPFDREVLLQKITHHLAH